MNAISNPTFVRRNRSLLAAAAVALVILFVLYRYSPERESFFPKCFFHYATGLHCPGCGATRCFHSLLHGDVQQAAAFNILVLVSLPFFVYAGLRALHARIRHQPAEARRIPEWTIRWILVVIVIFWIVRNLNISPFHLLAPHRL